MGTDIHTNVEAKIKGKWIHVDQLVDSHIDDPYYKDSLGDVDYLSKNYTVNEPIYDSRNYVLFGLLAGVRGADAEAAIPPRGMPQDASDTVRETWELDYGHTAHYYTLAELETINRKKKAKSIREDTDYFFQSVLPKLRSIQEEYKVTNKEVRLVFWFDS